METLEEMKLAMVPEYKAKFNKLEEIAFELHKMGYEDVEMAVIKKMAGLKLMIDHCTNPH
jgi:regulator of RNase E activity RraB